MGRSGLEGRSGRSGHRHWGLFLKSADNVEGPGACDMGPWDHGIMGATAEESNSHAPCNHDGAMQAEWRARVGGGGKARNPKVS